MTTSVDYGTRPWFDAMFSSADSGYDHWGHQWRASQKYRYDVSLSVASPCLSADRPQKILDIGSGLGDFTGQLAAASPGSYLYGLDISPVAVRYSRQRYPVIRFREGALPDIPFAIIFDGIVSLECLYYLSAQEQQAAVKNIRRHLIPEGWFLFSSHLDDGRRYFTPEQAISLFTNAGFRLRSEVYLHAGLYHLLEAPLLQVAAMERILEELETTPTDALSRRKQRLKRFQTGPLWDPLIAPALRTAARSAHRLLAADFPVHICDRIARRTLPHWSRSHIILLLERND